MVLFSSTEFFELGINNLRTVTDMKKILAVVTALTLLVCCFTACGSKKGYSVILESYSTDSYIKTIKVVKDSTDFNLAEAKEAVDNTPSTILEGVSKDEAEALKAKFEEVGATVTIEK